jgi:hypothetical protein
MSGIAPRTVLEHRFSSVEQLVAANLQPRARWSASINGEEIAGVVKLDGSLYPDPYSGRVIGSPELGSLSWTLVDGVIGDVTQDSTGVAIDVDSAGSAVTSVYLAGTSLVGPAIWEFNIQLSSILTPTLGMIAMCGFYNPVSGDWICAGFEYDTAWRMAVWAKDTGPAYAMFTRPTADAGSWISDGTFNAGYLPKQTSQYYVTCSLKSGGTIRITPNGLLSTSSTYLRPTETVSPFLYANAPGGSFTTKLTSLLIANSDQGGFW